jgi:phosphoribosyl-dephospho-CoA transferase
MNGVAMPPLHRHQIVWLSEGGWRNVQDRTWDIQACNCLDYWAETRLPLVVTQQCGRADKETIALGLSAPGQWGRRRLALHVDRSDASHFGEFARATEALALLPASTRSAWSVLCSRLMYAGVNARVYGSYGWQLLSGLDHVRTGSDIDLWLSVLDANQADAAAACLQSFESDLLRLDGELVFNDGKAVAWREWLAWRAGRVKGMLVKTLGGSELVSAPDWQGAMATADAA